MLYVLLILVVALAMVSGVEYAMLRVAKAEHKAEVARLKYANVILARKIESHNKLNSIKEGVNNE
jgi:hypothetical protein